MPRGSYLQSLSAEEKALLNQKRLEAKKRNHALRQQSTLRRDFSEEGGWLELARLYHVRMAAWGEPFSVSKARTFMHKLDWMDADYKDYSGGPLRDFAEMNPEWPLRAFEGLILEAHTRKKTYSSSSPKIRLIPLSESKQTDPVSYV